MYCINCGVELDSAEKVCPLCNTEAYHPNLPKQNGTKSYPVSEVPIYETLNIKGILFLITVGFFASILITTMCDLAVSGKILWSGYVTGGLLLAYSSLIMPFWFKRPNPVIFVPVNFAVLILFLLYINLATGGGWFLSFAFPVTASVCLLVTSMVTLCKYLKKGRLYVFGGGLIAFGFICCLAEFMLNITFNIKNGFPWSLYPLTALFLIGMALIVIAISKPLRTSLRKKFFI